MSYTLQIGFCRKDLTPEGAFPLGGYGDDSRRICEGVRDPITGTCLAITDQEGVTALLFSCDLISIRPHMTEDLRRSASKATGVPESHIHVGSTHNHSSPGISSPEFDEIQRFYRLFNVLMTEAAVGAMEDRAPAQLLGGDTHTKDLSFVRHYQLENGNFAGDNFGRWNSPIARHTSEPDTQMQMIRFVREEKPDILLVNWQAHTLLASTGSDEARALRRLLSSDYVGAFRRKMEEVTQLHVVYFLGACGNLNPYSRIKEENQTFDAHVHGALLADVALAALDTLHPIQGGPVTHRHRTVILPTDHSDDHLVGVADGIWEVWRTRPEEARQMARDNGFQSVFAARDVVGRSRLPESLTMELDALTFGDIGFVCVPYEMFCVNGQFVKENSPCPMTVVSTLTNSSNSYLASDYAFTHGGYEVDSRKFPRGTAETLANHFVEMLKEQKEEA